MANIILNGKTVVTQTGNDEPVLGSNVILTNSLASATFPAGHVIQVKYSEFLDPATFSYTSTTEGWDFGTQSTRADNSHAGILTDLELSITTKQDNSIFIINNYFAGCTNSDPNGAYNWGAGIFCSLDNYNSLISKGNKHPSYTSVGEVTYGRWIYPPNDSYSDEDFYGTIRHSPNQPKNTSITYRVVIDNAYTSGGNTVYVNYRSGYSNSLTEMAKVGATMTIMEIAV